MNIARKLVTPSLVAFLAVAGAFDTMAVDFAGIFPDFVRNCYIVSPGLIYPRASMTQVVDALEAAGYGVKVGPCVYREGNDDQYVASGAEKAQEFLEQYAKERWKGMAPVCWGDSLREAEYMRKLYRK